VKEVRKVREVHEEVHEPERYELEAGPVWTFAPHRRDFLKLVGGGLLVVSALNGDVEAQRSGDNFPDRIDAWLHIAPDGRVTAFTGKTEVGQNIRTSLTQAVAEELRVPPAAIVLVMADTAKTPYDAGTFGSRTTPVMARQLRRVAAAARGRLIAVAAERWGVDAASLRAADGKVTNTATSASLSYGELAQDERLAVPVGDPAVAPAAEWRVSGTALPKVNGREIVTGRHQFTPDLTRPGMVHGRIVRPNGFKATLASMDASAAEKMPGVTVVRDGDFVGVVAPSPRAAARAVNAVRAEWNVPPQISSRELYGHLRKPAAAAADSGRGVTRTGSLEEGRRAAVKTLDATYTVAYIAHVPMEPRAAVAEWNGDMLTVWTGTQRPFGVRSELARALRVPEERVRVIVPDTGSAYGGKHSGEAAIEAARLAKSAGRPVKLVWTREEEFTWAYFRPAGVIDVRSGVDADGRVVLWEFDNYNSGGSAIDTKYDVPNRRIQFHAVDSPLRQGSYRGLAATANHFARESHMDELAQLTGADAVAFRLHNLKDDRMRAVLSAAADRAGWGRKLPEGRGSGIAVGFEKGSYIATAVEVSLESGQPRLRRIVAAFECGAIVNPDGLKHQVEGAIVQGIGGALFESIDFESGRIVNPRLEQYRVPRFSDVPAIDIVLLDRKDLPSAGAGETPIVALAPAIASAIFALTGQRVRAMPLALTRTANGR